MCEFKMVEMTIEDETKARDFSFHKQLVASETKSTGGPPFMRFSLPWIPLPQFLAYVRASGGFSRY